MSEETPQKKKKKWYLQSFREKWLEDDNFKDWLSRDPVNRNNSYCLCCNITIKNAGKSMLLSHKKTGKHQKNFNAAKASGSIADYVNKTSPCEGAKLATVFFSEQGSATTPSSEDGLLDERNSRVIQINSNATPEVNLGSSSFKRIRVLNKEPLTSPVTGHDAHALGHSCPSAGHLNSSGVTPPEAPKEDEHDVFGRHVANELRSLPDDLNRRWARLKIQQVLFDAHSCPKES